MIFQSFLFRKGFLYRNPNEFQYIYTSNSLSGLSIDHLPEQTERKASLENVKLNSVCFVQCVV